MVRVIRDKLTKYTLEYDPFRYFHCEIVVVVRCVTMKEEISCDRYVKPDQVSATNLETPPTLRPQTG